MMKGLGYRDSDFSEIKLLSASRRYRKWLDEITSGSSWIPGAAVVTIFVEGSIKDRLECESSFKPPSEDLEEKVRNHPLVKFHGLDPACLNLVRAHHQIEGSHRKAAWNMILEHAQNATVQKKIYQALTQSLQLWLAYRDHVALACRLGQ